MSNKEGIIKQKNVEQSLLFDMIIIPYSPVFIHRLIGRRRSRRSEPAGFFVRDFPELACDQPDFAEASSSSQALAERLLLRQERK